MSQDQTLEYLKSQVGQEVHVSDWIEVTQARINAFAEATGDHQWIHVGQGDSPRGRQPSPTAT